MQIATAPQEMWFPLVITAKEEESGKKEGEESPGKAKLPYLGQARDEVAQVVGVSPRYVSDAKRVKEAAPAAHDAAEAG